MKSLLFENLNKHFPQSDVKMWKILYNEQFLFHIELVKKVKLRKKGKDGSVCSCNTFAT